MQFPLAGEQLCAAADAFLNFLEIEEGVIRQLHYPTGVERETPLGYTDKRAAVGKDPKRFFHYRPALEHEPTVRKLREEHEGIRTFLDSAASVHTAAERTAFAVCDAFPEIRARTVHDGRLARTVLRFLAYSEKTEGADAAFAAKAHYDKSFGALAIAESAPGLRIGCCKQHPLEQMTHRSGTSIFMPGLLFFETKPAVLPAWHDVIHAPDVPAVRPGCARWAIVLFIDDKDGNYPSWETAHTPVH